MSAVVLESTLACPTCGFRKTETMPTNACQFFYECPQCKTLLRPKAGDCCVFCSYGTVKCPPVQHVEAEIARALLEPHGMVDTVHVGRHDEEPQPLVEPDRRSRD